MNTCQTCRWWLKNDDLPGGVCELAFTTGDAASRKGPPVYAEHSQHLAYVQGRFAFFHTGPDFGCIHHEPHA